LLSRTLFDGFPDTMRLSDSLLPFVMAVPFPGPPCGPLRNLSRSDAGPPDSRPRCFRTCMRPPTPPNLHSPCRIGL
jgi:hypothetical protein